jgi:hypothetical protein
MVYQGRDRKRSTGSICSVVEGIVLQNIGKGNLCEHLRSDLEREVYQGEYLTIIYRPSDLARVIIEGPPNPECPQHELALELWNRKKQRDGVSR